MRIHKSDPSAMAGRCYKSWQEIMAVVKERHLERIAVLEERRMWNGIQ